MSGTRKWQEACDTLGADISRLVDLLTLALPCVEECEQFNGPAKPRLSKKSGQKLIDGGRYEKADDL